VSRYLTASERRLVADIVRSVNIDHQVASSAGCNPMIPRLDIFTTPELSSLGGGLCLLRCLSGEAALVTLGITGYRLVIGGLLYRAGPDPLRDTVGFADEKGRGNFLPDGTFFGHTWLQAGESIIDFSCGDWQGDAAAAQKAGTDNFQQLENLPPTVWQRLPPQFIWQHRSGLEPTSATRKAEAEKNGGQLAPPLGRAWYMGFDPGRQADAQSLVQRFRHAAHEDPAMRAAVKHIFQQITKHFGPRPRRGEETGSCPMIP
jgi:hypothetical protein